MKTSIKSIFLALGIVFCGALQAQDATPDAWEDNGNHVTFPNPLIGYNVGIGNNAPTAKLHVTGPDILLERGDVVAQKNALQISISGSPLAGASLSAGSINFLRKTIASGATLPDMSFSANGTALQMVIKHGGNVGIGTTNPADKLTVAGNIGMTGALNMSGTSASIKGGMLSNISDEFEIMGGSSLANSAYIAFRSGFSGNVNGPNSIAFISNGISDGAKGIEFVNYNTANSQWEPLGRITKDGRMGMGTGLGTPVSRLELANAQAGADKNVILTLTNKWLPNAANEPTLKFWNGETSSTNNIYWNASAKVASGDNTFSIAYHGPGSNVAEKNILRISGDAFTTEGTGQVIIGDKKVMTGTHTNFKLSVDGKIVAKEAVIQISDWADYVFDENYQLPSLDEVKDYVAENNHLPNVPATAEMVANGLNVTETSIKQQEKIEELFLYMIQLNERVKSLELENATLKANR